MAKVPLRAYNREIETMIDRGQLDEAIAHCHHIFKTFPKHLETYRLLGKTYLEYKRYKEAVDVFSRVLASEPNDFVANVGMSIIRDEENKLDDAIWHMERAFETQPSNAAIQSELQRLYGRRDGVQPPRIRMTRGALAHMYVQGELYPQAISEIKSVLKEDPGRSDMEALLARACYRSGLKNEAADAASRVLRRYPYCLDANRVLMEIFSTDKPDNAQIYRQRVLELDPYAAHVTGTVFQSNEVPDAAISLEHLDWNGQPVGTGAQAAWSENQAISLESGLNRDEQPEWLRNAYADTTPPTTPSPTRPIDPTTGMPVPAFDSSAQPGSKEDIPDFLRAAGWGQSTGAFDESKPIFGTDEPAAQPIEQGEIPDWVKAMAPSETTEPTPAADEELPDWINKIGTGSLPVPTASDSEQVDWMSQLGQTSEAASSPQTTSSDLDWMNQLGQESQSMTGESSVNDEPDWMKSSDQPASTLSSAAADTTPDWLTQPDLPQQAAPIEQSSDDQLDWLKQLDQTQPSASDPASEELPEWMKTSDQLMQSAPVESVSDEQPDWMKQFEETTPSVASSDQPDWLKQSDELAQAALTDQPAEEQPDWLRPLDITVPLEQAVDDQVDWMKPVEEPAQTASVDFDFLKQPEESLPEVPSVSPPAVDPDKLGVSEQERDDSFAWLESLAAKQGASEGLLTKPEERLEEEPDWVKQAKGLHVEPVASREESSDISSEFETRLLSDEVETESQWPTESAPAATDLPAMEELPSVEPSMPQPTSNLSDLGKSEQERDDSFAWLESLAAKQGASEGLLTKAEERLEQEPDWVKQAKDLSITTPEVQVQPPVESITPTEPTPSFETPSTPEPTINFEELGKSEQERDDSFAWLEGLAAKQGANEGLLTKPEDRLEQEPDWVKQAKDLSTTTPEVQVQPPVESIIPTEPTPSFETTSTPEPTINFEELGKSEQERDDSFAWLESLAAKQGASEGLLTKPEDRLEEEPDWVKQAKDVGTTPSIPTPVQEESVKEPVSEIPSADDTAAWLRQLDEEETTASEVPSRGKDETGIWLKSLVDEQSAAEPAEPASTRASDETGMWLRSLENEESKLTPTSTPTSDDTAMWLKSLSEEESKPISASESGDDETAMWLKSLDEAEKVSAEPEPEAEEHPELPAWMQNIDQGVAPDVEVPAQSNEVQEPSSWLNEAVEPEPPSFVSQQDSPKPETGSLPSWLRGLDKPEVQETDSSAQDELPAWLRDETGEFVGEPTRIEPTRESDWQPAQKMEPEPEPEPQTVEAEAVIEQQPVAEKEPEPPVAEVITPAPQPIEVVEEQHTVVEEALPPPEAVLASPPQTYKEPVTRKGTGRLTMPAVDSVLGSARNELSRSNIPGALDSYSKLIRKGRFLDEIIYDLRDALYRYPVEVSIWQSLGDAYMRANRLQDALDAYTKAEELLR